MLAKKDAEEAAAIDELRDKAKKELGDWYKHSDEQLQATKATNRYLRCAIKMFNVKLPYCTIVCIM